MRGGVSWESLHKSGKSVTFTMKGQGRRNWVAERMSIRLQHSSEKVSARPTGMQMQNLPVEESQIEQKWSVTDWGYLGKLGL